MLPWTAIVPLSVVYTVGQSPRPQFSPETKVSFMTLPASRCHADT
ncbi:hypothetical protein FHU37_002639 [Allostreptomyces psammosilenae]|uniref:Uncharacterized protein n=1 Tax=Allostreptomyces psammosilenae TaxID=1892865 RepID=A0A852ZTF9_9ACTN|nr:hypothetical protein [Allostreptomyces psammosilenae]